jgi:hypothetical protein
VVPLSKDKLEQAPRDAHNDSPACTDDDGRRVSTSCGVEI